MKELGLLALTLPIIFLLSTCAVRPDGSAQRAALLGAERDAINAANSRDTQRIVDTYVDDAVGLPPNTPALIGKDAIREYVSRWVQEQGVVLTYQSLKVEVSHDGTLGYTASEYEVTTTHPDGRRELIRKGRWVQVWRNQDGRWKLAVEIWNPSEATTSETP